MQPRRKHSRTCASRRTDRNASATMHDRSGIAAIWLVMAIPVFAAVLVFVLNLGYLWIARCELENAAISGALAGVKVRCDDDHGPHKKSKKKPKKDDDGRNERDAVQAAEQFIEANCVLHHPIRLSKNHKSSGNNDKPLRTKARIAFGRVDHRKFQIRKSSKHDCACLVELSKTVEGPVSWFWGRKTIHVRAVAVPSGKHSIPKLVEIDEVKSD